MPHKDELTPESIQKMVNDHETQTQALRSRMEADYNLYRLVEVAQEGLAHTYTSNEPRTYADKIKGWLANAKLVFDFPDYGQKKDEREVESEKERFVIGALRSADDRLLRQMLPRLQDQLAFFIPLRGIYAVRTLLYKKDKEGVIDIVPWDPLHTFWGVDSDGLTWACYRYIKTVEQIYTDYGVEVAGENGTDGVTIYDHYNRDDNSVSIEGTWLKEPTTHKCSRVPVALGVAGDNPPIQSDNTTGDVDDAMRDFGESIYAANRVIYPQDNAVMSAWYTLVRRSARQGYVIESPDGTKELEDDPNQEGVNVLMKTGLERMAQIPYAEMQKDTGAFVSLVAGEKQRGALPYSIYGEVPFQLSGYAINTLRQGVDAVIEPRVRAMENCYMQIVDLICEQYGAGAVGTMTFKGQDYKEEYFSQEFKPSSIKGIGSPDVKLLPQLPEDDTSKFAMAQIAREGESPLMPDDWIRGTLLGVQDADQIKDRIREQLAERLSPMAMLYTLMESLQKRGRPDLAAIYWNELITLMQQQALQDAQNQPAQGPPVNGNGNGAGPLPGFPVPSVSPPAAQGVPPPQPTPQAGPLVPPGSPRPGALSEEERAARIGIAIARS